MRNLELIVTLFHTHPFVYFPKILICLAYLPNRSVANCCHLVDIELQTSTQINESELLRAASFLCCVRSELQISQGTLESITATAKQINMGLSDG